ncbi:hypothetical protein TIFTF001_012908 [Ficus carica]|uniref:Uncharacterized protein n=1 Tax=Ficus carica TaxID=3494 RepID=A0AA88D5J1_FICCA|nr:hypothetical protein TIFTF001_012908 [Ficus carica]
MSRRRPSRLVVERARAKLNRCRRELRDSAKSKRRRRVIVVDHQFESMSSVMEKNCRLLRIEIALTPVRSRVQIDTFRRRERLRTRERRERDRKEIACDLAMTDCYRSQREKGAKVREERERIKRKENKNNQMLQ